jgi:hypothetical protein
LLSASTYELLATGLMAVHLLWIAWVIFGALFTRNRPMLAALHIGSLTYGILIEAAGFTCPLTYLEQWLQAKGGVEPFSGAFIGHYVEALVYPDVPFWLLAACSIAVCVFNLGIYARRYARRGAAEPAQTQAA